MSLQDIVAKALCTFLVPMRKSHLPLMELRVPEEVVRLKHSLILRINLFSHWFAPRMCAESQLVTCICCAVYCCCQLRFTVNRFCIVHATQIIGRAATGALVFPPLEANNRLHRARLSPTLLVLSSKLSPKHHHTITNDLKTIDFLRVLPNIELRRFAS